MPNSDRKLTSRMGVTNIPSVKTSVVEPKVQTVAVPPEELMTSNRLLARRSEWIVTSETGFLGASKTN